MDSSQTESLNLDNDTLFWFFGNLSFIRVIIAPIANSVAIIYVIYTRNIVHI